METTPSRSLTNPLFSNILVQIFSFCVLVCLACFAFILTIKAKSCSTSVGSNFYPKAGDLAAPAAENGRHAYYVSVFQNLMNEGMLSKNSSVLCIDSLSAEEVLALREIGVVNSIGISSKNLIGLEIQVIQNTEPFNKPFDNDTFDFEISNAADLEREMKPVQFAVEVSRTLKPGGFFVLHMKSVRDGYRFNSLLQLFGSFSLVKSRDIEGFDALSVHEVVLQKANKTSSQKFPKEKRKNKCSIPRHKRELIRKAEPLIKQEPLHPWMMSKRNVHIMKYLPTMADISFKNRYIYVEVGSKSYGTSIGSWFYKIYPKQDKNFEVYSIGADVDPTSYNTFKTNKGSTTLLPHAAWIKNETLFFKISREQGRKNKRKGRGTDRIHDVQTSSSFVGGESNKVEGFDFAMWLKSNVGDMDYVIVKMNVEGAEFQLIPRLVGTGAACLIDEMFLECHYNRWQKCCPGKRSHTYNSTYVQCLELFWSLRRNGVLAHQWW